MVIITTVRIFITLPPLSLLRGFVVFCSVFLFRLSPFLACLLFLSLSRSFGPILDSSLLFSLSDPIALASQGATDLRVGAFPLARSSHTLMHIKIDLYEYIPITVFGFIFSVVYVLF